MVQDTTDTTAFSFDPSEVNLMEEIINILNLTIFRIQTTPVTVSSILLFILFLIFFSIAGRIFSRILFKRILGSVAMDEGIRFTLMRFTNYFIVFVGVVISFQFLGIDLSGLAVIFGLLSVGIGFGLQNVTSNFIAGIILLIERPIRIGDRVVVNEQEGDVAEINMRSTTIQSLENISIIVPNADFISGKVINYSHGDSRIKIRVSVGVSYSSDLDLVLKTLKEAALMHEEVIKEPAPVVIFRDFGDSAWELVVVAWIENPKRHPLISSEIRINIVRLFAEHKIEIPFPQHDLNFKNTLTFSKNIPEQE